MEKIKNFLHSKTFIDILIIITVMIICTIISGFIMDSFLSDRGREFLFPEAILNGLVPYKDITMVYLPLSYYINALIYKLFGVSLYSLIIFQACFCTFFMIVYYFLAKEFVGRKISISLTIFIILYCIFCLLDLFSYIIPYAFARVYGIIGSICCLFFLLKLFKTNNIRYGYLAAFAVSFAISNKLEYISAVFILIAGLLLYKRLKITQYIKIFLITLFFPFLTVILLAVSGVSVLDIVNAIKFTVKFSSTEAIQYYFAFTGTTPFMPQLNLITKGILPLTATLSCCALYCFLDKKFNNKFIFPCMLIITTIVCIILGNTEYYWFELPLFVVLSAILFFKKIIKERNLLLLLIATLILAQREMFKLLYCMGTYPFPLLILFTIVIFKEYIFETVPKVTVEKFITFFLIVLIGSYSIQQVYRRIDLRHPLKTAKGTVYMSNDKLRVYGKTLGFIHENISEDAKILVLPEGLMFNFISDRKVNMHCPIMDRPYYDAYGGEKALEMVKNSDYDYIIIAKGFDLFDFGFEYLYSPEGSTVSQYIYENYTQMQQEYGDDNESYVAVYKRNDLCIDSQK